MPIPNSFIQQLVANCDIESIMSSYVNLSRDGRNKKCLCPFHSEKTPSCVVYPNTQSFYCFGCGAGGDVITFIMKIENLSYIETVKFLAARVGMTVPEDEADNRTYQLRARILEINRLAAKFFHTCLKSEDGQHALSYLRARELSDQTITNYGLGYAPDSWDSLRKFLHQKGYTDDEMLAAAVLVKSAKGHVYDQFRNRVMFPIIDLRGNVIAFGGRVLDDSKPKYLNTGDTPVFKKSRNLFSLNFAKNVKTDRMILAEGYMDVIAIYQGGFQNVVATLGTALTSDQARLLSQYAKEIVIAYDSDGPGQAATKRAVALIEEVGMTPRVLHIEGAKDPDEYIKKFGSTRFKLLLDGAANATDAALLRIKETHDLSTEDGKLAYVKQAIALLSDLKSPLEQEVYAGKLSLDTGITRDTLIEQIKALRSRKRRSAAKKEWKEIETGRKLYQDRINPQRASHLKQAAAEEGLIAALFKSPDIVSYLLQQLSAEDFVTDFNKRLFVLITEQLQQGSAAELSALAQQLQPDEMGRLSSILAKSDGLTVTRQQVDDLIRVLLDFRKKADPASLSQMTDDEYLDYIKRIQAQKK